MLDADALNITGAQLASGLTGWEIVGRPTIANGRVTVDLRDINDTESNPLPSGDREVIRLIADVPDIAVFNSAEVIEVSAGARAGSRRVAISDSTSVQKVLVFGDVNNTGGTNLDVGDVITLRRLVSRQITGFNFATLTDPSLMTDANATGAPDVGDVLVFRRAISPSGDSRIPTFPVGLTSVTGPDPTIAISSVTAATNSTARVNVAVTNSNDVPQGIGALNLFIRFDPNVLSVASTNNIISSQDILDLGYTYAKLRDNTNGVINVI